MRLQLKQRVTDTQLILDLHFCVNEEGEICKHSKTRILKHKVALIELQYHFFPAFLANKMYVCMWLDRPVCFLFLLFSMENLNLCVYYIFKQQERSAHYVLSKRSLH